MGHWGILLTLACLLAAQYSAAQQLTCFFKTDFPKYTSDEQSISVLFTMQAPPAVEAPVSLTSVLDRSGSMAGPKMELLKKTTQFLVNKLAQSGGKHSLGVVTYSDRVQDLTQVLPVSSSNAPLLNALLAGVNAAGQTFLSGGLNRGVEQQRDAPGGKIKSVYLFTDGLPTVGATSTEDILSQVNEIRSSSNDKITISTFGFGQNLNVGLLQSISSATGGETYIISSEDDIPAAFGDALGGLLSTAAQDISVVFKAGAGATIETVQTGGVVTSVDGGIRVQFANLFAEEKRDILFKLKLPSGSGGEPVLQAQLQYTDGASLQRITKDPSGVILDRSSPAPVEETPEKDVETADLRFTTAEAIATAKSKASEGDSEGAATAIATAVAKVEISPVKDDPTIQALLKDIQTIKELLEKKDAAAAAETAGELESTLKTQRSSGVGSNLASAQQVDTKKKQETREESKAEVLSPAPVAEPSPPPSPSPAPAPEGEPSGTMDEPAASPSPSSSQAPAPVGESSGPVDEPAASPSPSSSQAPAPAGESSGPVDEPAASPSPSSSQAPAPAAESSETTAEPSPSPSSSPAPQAETSEDIGEPTPSPSSTSGAEPQPSEPQPEDAGDSDSSGV